jgi:hypothetical protein
MSFCELHGSLSSCEMANRPTANAVQLSRRKGRRALSSAVTSGNRAEVRETRTRDDAAETMASPANTPDFSDTRTRLKTVVPPVHEGLCGAYALPASYRPPRSHPSDRPFEASCRGSACRSLCRRAVVPPVGPIVGPNIAVPAQIGLDQVIARTIESWRISRQEAARDASAALLHTREVAGSKPAAPIRREPRLCWGSW